MGRCHTGHNLGSHEDFIYYVLSHARPFLFGCCISFPFLQSEVVRVYDFWTHLEMCVIIFALLQLILNSGTVSGEMRS